MLSFYEGLADNFFATDAGDPDRISFSNLGYNCTDAVVDALQSGGVLSGGFSLGAIARPNELQSRFNQKYESQNSSGLWQTVKNWFNRSENGQVADISSRGIVETNNR